VNLSFFLVSNRNFGLSLGNRPYLSSSQTESRSSGIFSDL
jgi:hypothetical protein